MKRRQELRQKLCSGLVSVALAVGMTPAVAFAVPTASGSGIQNALQSYDSATGVWTDNGGNIDIIYDTTNGTWIDPEDDVHNNGTYVITIPRLIKYEHMNAGKVDVKDDYTVNVKGVINSGSSVVVMAEQTKPLTLSGASDLTATCTQGKTKWTDEEVYGSIDASGRILGTDCTDTIALSGIANATGDYIGFIQYLAELKEGAVFEQKEELDDYTPAEIMEIADMIADGDEEATEYMEHFIGERFPVELTNGEQAYGLLVGVNHTFGTGEDQYTEPLTFNLNGGVLLEPIATCQWNLTNTVNGGYKDSYVRSQLQPGGSIYNLVPEWLREKIIPAYKISHTGGPLETNKVVVTKDILWLPSFSEFGGSGAITDGPLEGTTYERYRDKFRLETWDASKVAGNSVTRSVMGPASTHYVIGFNYNSATTGSGGMFTPTQSVGVSPYFVIGGTMKEDGTLDVA